MPDAFTTLANLKQWIGPTDAADDALLQNLIYRSTAYLQNYLDRRLASATFTEYYDGDDRPGIVLREGPVTSLTSVHLSWNQTWDSGSLVAATSITLDARSRRIWLRDSVFDSGFQNVRVIYVAGYTSPGSTPGAVEQACIEIASYYNRRRSTGDISAWSLKDGSVSYQNQSAGEDQIIRRLASQADFYRRRSVA